MHRDVPEDPLHLRSGRLRDAGNGEGRLTGPIGQVFWEFDRPESPGCAVGVFRDGEIEFARGYGLACIEHGVRFAPSTVSRSGSVAKQFCAATIAMLDARGVLHLDDTIRKHVDGLPDIFEPVTVRHLVHHTGGVRDFHGLRVIATGLRGLEYARLPATEGDVVDLMRRQRELNFAPGERFLYSNSGYVLLAAAVRSATGRSLREVAAEEIFGPLGMTSTHWHDDHSQVVGNSARAYSPRAGGGFRLDDTTIETVGHGNLFTTIDDLLQWERAFLSARLVPEDLFARMSARGVLNSGEQIPYAFGLRHDTYRDLPTLGHGGATAGFRTVYLRFPSERLAIAILANHGSIVPPRLAQRVADIVLDGRLGPEPVRRELPHEEPLPPGWQIVGTWTSAEPEVTVTLTQDAETLLAEIAGATYRVEPVSPTRFLLVDSPFAAEASVRREDREIAALVVNANDIGTFELARSQTAQLDDPARYEGAYACPELNVTWELALVDGDLRFVHHRAPEEPVCPAPNGALRCGAYTLRFDDDGFRLDAGRVLNLRFVRSR